MKKGDLVRGYDGWLGRVVGFGKSRKVKNANNVEIVWETGPLKKREALVPRTEVKKA